MDFAALQNYMTECPSMDYNGDDGELLDIQDLQYKEEIKVPKKSKEEIKQDKVQAKATEQFTKEIQRVVKNKKKMKVPIEESDDEGEVDVVKHQRLVLLLQMYLNEFKEKLKDYQKLSKGFGRKSYSELMDIKKQFDTILTCKSNISQGIQMCNSGVALLEQVSGMVGVNCNGLSNMCANDAELQDQFKILILQKMPLVDVKVEYQIAMKIGGNMVMLHQMNGNHSNNSLINPGVKQGIDNINLKYNDI
jgi:hypothetical protein